MGISRGRTSLHLEASTTFMDEMKRKLLEYEISRQSVNDTTKLANGTKAK